jgi:GlpG protein
MRCIGHLSDEAKARTFSDFLYVEGIANQVEEDAGHGWAVWVSLEDQLAPAAEWLAKYRRNPDDARYRQKARQAEVLKEQAVKSDADYARKIKDGRTVFRPVSGTGSRPLTTALIAISAGVYLTALGPAAGTVSAWFSFSQAPTGMPEILHGEIWRLLTPVFLHFGILHILFNMFWLWDLGGLIENRLGPARLAVLLVALAAVSNLVQYGAGTLLLKLAAADTPNAVAIVAQRTALLLGSGGHFGGMSGVNFGLLGYVWMRGRHDPGSGLILNPQTLLMALVWFVLCFTPVFGNVANGCHLAGLVLGTGWGYLAARRAR